MDIEKHVKELKLLSPQLSDEEAREITMKLFQCWGNIYENIDLFKN